MKIEIEGLKEYRERGDSITWTGSNAQEVMDWAFENLESIKGVTFERYCGVITALIKKYTRDAVTGTRLNPGQSIAKDWTILGKQDTILAAEVREENMLAVHAVLDKAGRTMCHLEYEPDFGEERELDDPLLPHMICRWVDPSGIGSHAKIFGHFVTSNNETLSPAEFHAKYEEANHGDD